MRRRGDLPNLMVSNYPRNCNGGGASGRIGAALSHAKQNCLFRQLVGQLLPRYQLAAGPWRTTETGPTRGGGSSGRGIQGGHWRASSSSCALIASTRASGAGSVRIAPPCWRKSLRASLRSISNGSPGGIVIVSVLRRSDFVCRRVMVRFCLQEGDLFIHNTNSVFTALPFTMVALQDPASEFALR
jgi:hypothetical protein